jgi:hypothetical protein
LAKDWTVQHSAAGRLADPCVFAQGPLSRQAESGGGWEKRKRERGKREEEEEKEKEEEEVLYFTEEPTAGTQRVGGRGKYYTIQRGTKLKKDDVGAKLG